MSLILQIVPFNHEIDMFGEPDPVSAYSLSGHVSLSLASSFSFFESRRPARLLLQSLSLTFEGQSEVFTQDTGYSSVRLCSITRELVPRQSIELTNDGEDESSSWNIVFDLPVPGWLPGSSAHGAGDFGVKYSLSATARFMSLDSDSSTSSWRPLSVLCAPFRPRFRSAETCKTIKLRRFVNPPRAEAVEIPNINYLVNSGLSSTERDDKDRIPRQVLASIQILVSVPEYVDVKGSEVSLSIRLRSKNLCEEECNRLQLTATGLDIVQYEQFRCRPSPSYLAQYPVPPKEMQPPILPLNDSHPINYIHPEFFSANLTETSTRSFSLISDAGTGKFLLNYIFKDDRNEVVPTWYTINVTLPFDNTGTTSFDTDGTFAWTDFVGLRASTCEPLFNVYHELAISLSMRYDLENGRAVQEKLRFKVPMTFANVAPRTASASANLTSVSGGSIVVPNGASPAASSLPAYSQLYDRNGERKIDYSVPLPLYTPKPCKGGDSVGFKYNDERNPSLVNEEKHLLSLGEAEPTASAVQ